METCPKCNSKVFHNKGISAKTNKPYENFKCGKCDFIEWVSSKGSSGGNEEIMKALRIIHNDIQTLKAKGTDEIPVLEDE